jgi:YtkA-like
VTALLLLFLVAERYQIALRLPPGGLYAGEEMEIEFRVEDSTKPDPLGGFTPVVRLAPTVTIDMPEMPGMPKIDAIAHAEGAPGDYGIHPTFPHGGAYRLRIAAQAPGGDAIMREFPLTVKDADPKRKPPPPRFTLDLKTEPRRPKAGEPVELRLAIRDRDTPVSAFEIVHEKPMHLIAVRKDLAHFAHEHPTQAGNEFRLRFTFASGGEHRIFADVAPKGAGSQILMASLKVAGAEARETPRPGAGVAMKSEATLPARQSTTVLFRFADPQGLEPYLGAAGHLILIHEDAATFVHSHPAHETVTDGELRFLSRLPKAGAYRGWLQFQRSGKVITHDVLVRARE